MKKLYLCEVVKQLKSEKNGVIKMSYEYLENRVFVIVQEEINNETKDVVYRDLFNDKIYNKNGSLHAKNGENVVIPGITIVGRQKHKLMNYLDFSHTKPILGKNNKINHEKVIEYFENLKTFIKEHPDEGKEIIKELLSFEPTILSENDDLKKKAQDIPAFSEGYKGQAITNANDVSFKDEEKHSIDCYEEGPKGQAFIKK